jgi:hypothetical protein
MNPDRCNQAISPAVGGSCAACGRAVPPFPGVTALDELEILEHIRNARTVSAIEHLRNVSGVDLAECRWMIEHMYALAGLPGFERR